MTQFILVILWIQFDGDPGSIVSGYNSLGECQRVAEMIGPPPTASEIQWHFATCITADFHLSHEPLAGVQM